MPSRFFATCAALRARSARVCKRVASAARKSTEISASHAALLASSLVVAQLLAPGTSHAGECSGIADKGACPQAIAVESARGIGLGTGVRASSISTSSLAYSPAALSLGNLYHVEGSVDYLGGLNTVALGGAVVDSSTSKLGAGLALRGFLSGQGGGGIDDVDGLDGRLGLGLNLSDAFAIGLAARYIDISTDVPNGDDVDENTLAKGFTLDSSIRVIPTQGLQIDIGALNFVDLQEAEVPITLTGSIALAVGDAISLGGDVLVDVSTFDDPAIIAGGGLEFLAGGVVPLRVGYRGDMAREVHAITAGLGYNDAAVGFDIGLRQEVAGSTDTRVFAAMRYYVH